MDSKLDRAFTTWKLGGPGDRAVAIDYSRLESSIISTLRRVAGYPDPNKEGGTFDPNKLTSAYLSKLDTNKRVSFISDMAGLLWYRALPLSRLARKNLLSDDTRSVQNSSVCSDDSKEKVEKLMEHLDYTRDRLENATDLLLNPFLSRDLKPSHSATSTEYHFNEISGRGVQVISGVTNCSVENF